jgi:pimeloyl-ACP methyl ester carboxylesterase
MLGLAERVRNEGIQSAAILAMTSNFAVGEDDRDARREHVRKEVAASNPQAYAMVCEAMVSAEHIDPDYSSIVCPAVFVSGRGDVISPPARAHGVSGLMGGKTLVEIVRGGHQPVLSDLEGTRDAMVELFRLMSSSSEQG